MATNPSSPSALFGEPDGSDPFDDLLADGVPPPPADEDERMPAAPVHSDEASRSPPAHTTTDSSFVGQPTEAASSTMFADHVAELGEEVDVRVHDDDDDELAGRRPPEMLHPVPAMRAAEIEGQPTLSSSHFSLAPPADDELVLDAPVQPTESQQIAPHTDEVDALFEADDGLTEQDDGWLGEDDHVPADEIARTELTSSAPEPSAESPQTTTAAPIDDLFGSDQDGQDDFLAEENELAGAGKVREPSNESTDLSELAGPVDELAPVSVLPQPTAPHVAPISPILPQSGALGSAPTMSDLFASSQDTSDDWLASEPSTAPSDNNLALDLGSSVGTAAVPPADTNELFGSADDDGEDLFGGSADGVVQELELPTDVQASTGELTFERSPPGATDELSFDDPSDSFLAPEPGPVQEMVAVASPGGTWPSVPGSPFMTKDPTRERALHSPAIEQTSFDGSFSESAARRTPLASPFLPSQEFSVPAVQDMRPPVSLQPAPLGRSTSSNPYASGAKPKTTNPYATSNPYAAAPLSSNPYSTPAPASANPYGASSTSSTPAYGLAPAGSANPYFPAASVYSPPVAAPAKPAPPPFQRQTTQTYNAYDPPAMPVIPVRRAKPAAPPVGGAWAAQPSPMPSPYASGYPPVASPPPKPAGPPPPPPKRADTWSQRPAPPAGLAYASPPQQHQPPLPKAFSPPPAQMRAPPPPKTFSPPPARTFTPPLPRAPPPGRAPSYHAPPAPIVAAFQPTMPSALGVTASSLMVSDPYDDEDGGATPRIVRPDGPNNGVPAAERSFMDDDGGEGGGEDWKEELEDERGSIDLQRGPSARSSLDLPNGRSSMESAPRWGQPPPPRATTPSSYTRSVVSPPPGPPPRPSSTVSNASSRYGAMAPPMPPPQPPASDYPGYQAYSSAPSAAPYAQSTVGTPPPRPPSASQGRPIRAGPPAHPPPVPGQAPVAPPRPTQTPPPPRPASAASNAYASYGLPAAQASPQRMASYSPAQPTTSLPHPPQPSASFAYGSQPQPSGHGSVGYDSSRAGPYGSGAMPASVSSTSLAGASVYTPDVVLSLAEDPLGRASEKFKKVPVMSFGFGGKVVVCYPSLGGGGGYGFAAAGELEAGDGRTVRLNELEDVVPETALASSTARFPGPVFLDPATAKGATGDKAKKAAVLGYLDARAVEIESGLGWLKGKGDDAKFRSEEGKAVLMRLLAVMVSNEGRLMGSAKVDEDVRAILLPNLAPLSKPTLSPLITPGLPVPLAAPGPSSVYSTSPSGPAMHSQRNSLDLHPHPAANGPSTANRPANLDHLSALLLRGEKKQAVQFAIEEKMWSHALIISSCIDKHTWGEVVTAFSRAELPPCPPDGSAKSRDALRLTYEMFGGAGTTTINRALPAVGADQASSAVVSVEPPPPVRSTSKETLSNWREVVAMLVSNRSLGDTEALQELGDSLVGQGWTSAGHCCYLLSAPTPPLDGLGSPVPPRIHLYGCSFNGAGSFDLDGVLITEIVEYALSLIPVLKGQEPYSGVAYLQAYKLIHALHLAETGDNATAQRYCEAIASSLKSCRVASPHHTLPFLNQLKELSDRLSGTAQMDKSGASWISRNVSKPSLDSFGTWFEGRLSKFVAGEEADSPTPQQSTTPGKPSSLAPDAAVGPFSHFDAISPAPTSTSFLNRAASSANLTGGFPGAGNDQAFPKRSGSAMALRPGGQFGMQPLDRSSSALDFTRTNTAPPVQQPMYSADHARSSFDRSASAGPGPSSGYTPYGGGGHGAESSSSSFSTNYGEQIPSTHGSVPDGLPPSSSHEGEPAWGGGWGSTGSAYDQPTEHNTPTANSFQSGQTWGSSYGQDSYTSDATATNGGESDSRWGGGGDGEGGGEVETLDDEDDLGLGNSKGKKKKDSRQSSASAGGQANDQDDEHETPKGKATDKEDTKTAEIKPAASTGWLGRLWGGKKEDPAAAAAAAAAAGGKPPPIKAKLGEESAFYYDKDLKKWVNKKAGPEDAAASKPPPPPPSRSQTVSPSRGHRPPPSLSAGPSTARLDGSFPSGGPPTPGGGPRERIVSAPATRPPTGPPSRAPSTAGSGAGTPPTTGPPGGGPPKPGDPPRSTSVPPFRGPVADPTAELLARTPTPGAGGSAAARKKNLRSRYVDVFEQS